MSVLGVLMLDTRFPRLPGDIGSPATLGDVPGLVLRHRVVRGASPTRVVRERDPALLQPFIEAGRALVDEGADLVTTSCGFLVLFQEALQQALPVPVVTSSLLALPRLQAIHGAQGVGIVTAEAASLGDDHLRAAGAAPDTPVEGLEPGSAFHAALLDDHPHFDPGDAEATTVAAAMRLVRRHPGVRAILLECTNLPPYAAAVRDATGRPVHDLTTLLRETLPS